MLLIYGCACRDLHVLLLYPSGGLHFTELLTVNLCCQKLRDVCTEQALGVKSRFTGALSLGERRHRFVHSCDKGAFRAKRAGHRCWNSGSIS